MDDYFQPERIDPENSNYDIRADVWSLGISLVELATGRFPYPGCTNEFEILSRILKESAPQLTLADGFSDAFCDFVRQCLTKEHLQRPKYKQLLVSNVDSDRLMFVCFRRIHLLSLMQRPRLTLHIGSAR